MIDLRSDTVTKPNAMMREAMCCAPVGDDVYGEDPTVNRMQEIAAALLGKTAALYVPSGIMANQLSIRAQTQPGDEVIIESSAHIVLYEHGAAAALAGAQLHGITGDRGILEPEQVEAAIQPKDPYHPRTSLICLENTHNSGGGSIYPLAKIERTRSIAQAHGIAMHLDGARLFNAVVATGIPAAEYARHFDTVSFCLSKGLGAPVGSLIVTNDGPIIEQLRRSRRMYGGGMRQAGILAAAGIYALERNIPRLKEDHDNARRLAELLNKVATVSVDVNHVETNIVIFDVVGSSRSASEIVDALRKHGVLLNAVGKTTFRAVTHLGVDAQEIEQAGQILFQVLS
ncbi:low-specificity L-threonine aldolase [Nitrospiraceae bacterium AH_259_D15_M11_P09]|nr:low-specificity L-threonine aldolase [Nitrospiraceae bacterium AH_259_D15_M11_P09]